MQRLKGFLSQVQTKTQIQQQLKDVNAVACQLTMNSIRFVSLQKNSNK